MLNVKRCLSAVSKAFSRAELDFDFLLDTKNLELIRSNIRSRKGIGDIAAVHRLWKEIQKYPGKEVRCEQEYQDLWDKFYEEASLIPNMNNPDVPMGDSACSRVVCEFGPSANDWPTRETAETIGVAWRALNNPVNACGEKSYTLLGPLCDLERAMVNFALAFMEKNGFRRVWVPDMIHQTVTEACGVQQRSEKDILYRLIDHNGFCLSGTSEMGLSSLLKNCVVHSDELPMKLTTVSRCYRPEIASNALESKLFRVHEFTKVEMFIVCKQEESDMQLQHLVDLQCSIFASLGLRCRLMDMSSEELGASAARKFDIEAWMPGRGTFGEVSSASNCTDYQSRRLGLKYIDSNGLTRFAHTCNGTAIATIRAIIALLETYQNERKGLVRLPSDIQCRLPTKRSWTVKMGTTPDLNGIDRYVNSSTCAPVADK